MSDAADSLRRGPASPRTSALIIVDLQEDFCPPNGSLAVPGGREVAAIANRLLDLPFALKIATKDWHPQDHVSFASNHAAPQNVPFESVITMINPLNREETLETKLWPDHCVQNTKGAELLPELDASKLTQIVEKGQDARVEMYSAFRDPFRKPTVTTSSLAATLHNAEIERVYVCGLATDFCVFYTAMDAVREGFETVIINDGVRGIDDAACERAKRTMGHAGIHFVDDLPDAEHLSIPIVHDL